MGFCMLARQDGHGLAAVEGEMNIYTVAALKDDIGRAAALHGELEIDLSGVSDLDAAGLQLMLMAKRIAGHGVRFIKHSPPVLALLEMSNLAGAIGDPLVLTSGDGGKP